MNTGSTDPAAAATAAHSGGGEGFVELRGITKRFPGVLANDDISLDFRPGEIHVLLGENGAGKSTLIGILAGMQQPDAGEIRVRGASVRIGSPRESLELGIGTVFQHVLLVQSLTVLENLMLGGAWWRRIDRDAALKRFRELSELLALEISPDALVGRLSLGQQQQVEIVRALWRGEGVLVLDEPTSMLTPEGVRELGQVMVRLRDEGVAIVFITHKLQEAYAFGDRISVLRLGKLVGSIDKERLSGMDEQAVTDEVIRLMFGSTEGHDQDAETLSGLGHRRPHLSAERQAEEPCLNLRAVSTQGDVGECPLQDVSFSLFPGEILGIAGVDGNGQKHLAEAVAGQRLAAQGEIFLEGAKIERLGVPDRRKLGIRYITDERLGEGTVGAFSVAHNVVMKEIGQPPLWRHGISLWDRIFAHARGQIREHDVRTPSERTPIGRLSGGNIQKVLLARELADDLVGEAKVVVFNKPTYGLDLQSTRFARDRIRRGAESGLATILISTELDELIELSDRIAVMFQGRLAGIVENGEGVEREIGLLMTGAAAA
ncbi:ABC transporter ATP-binding protein [Pelagibius litoralis]|uniref:ABC transporter ATP-binding protein n=1 Tax=Pelagibius litoralis TaxID=374515 RepID=A0A967K9A5_9PROT|nr:ABC transporter ATP-binding protein [Pelagibius litoralis]NIA69747.1 ABC transporter ATP-binding protein [Pelagibius litoralis]